MRTLAPALAFALSLAPAFALRPTPEHDEVLIPYLKQGYHEGQSIARDDAKLGVVHALVLEEGEGVARHRSLVFVFATKGDHRALIHQAEYAWAALDGLSDIDGDGNLDLVVRAGTGGNCWTCGWVEAVTLTADRALPLVPPERFQELEDVDGDGTLEGIASDARWEFFEGLCHACSPRVERIHKRTSGAWVDASQAFPAHYKRAIESLELQLEAQAKENPSDWDEYQFGTLASIALNKLALGDSNAWKDFDLRIEDWRKRADAEGLTRLNALVAALKLRAR